MVSLPQRVTRHASFCHFSLQTFDRLERNLDELVSPLVVFKDEATISRSMEIRWQPARDRSRQGAEEALAAASKKPKESNASLAKRSRGVRVIFFT